MISFDHFCIYASKGFWEMIQVLVVVMHFDAPLKPSWFKEDSLLYMSSE